MRIGVAKEIKPQEYRVALTPAGARELVQRGHEVIVETGAGDGSAFPDTDYEAIGARIATVDEVWERAELLLKVKEPIEPEYGRLREGLVLFTYLHIAADEPLTRALVDSGIAAVAYETVETDDRRLPLLAPMSEVAGRLAAQAGALYLEKAEGRPRPAARRGRRRGSGQGRRDRRRDRRLQRRGDRARPRRAGDDPRALGRPDAPPRGGAARPGEPADVVEPADRELDRGRRRRDRRRSDPRCARAEARDPRDDPRDEAGSVFCDVAIDQGGCAETSHPTTHDDPVYVVDGVTHYCVANMPGAVPITSTKALTNVTLPYVEAIADHGLAAAVAADPALATRRQRARRQDHVRGRRRGARPRLHAARRCPERVGALGL